MAVLALAAALTGGCDGQGTDPTPFGTTVWRTKLDLGGGWGRNPVLAGDVVIFPDGPGLRALRLADGTEAWRSEALHPKAVGSWLFNLAVRDSTVYGAHGYEVAALSTTTGTVRWRFTPPTSDTGLFTAETLADARGIVVGTRGHVYAIDPATQALQWDHDVGVDWFERANVQGFAASGDTLFVTVSAYRTPDTFTPLGIVLALDRRTGTELWRWESDVSPTVTNGPPLLSASTVLATDLYGRFLYAVDRTTGRERWRLETTPGWLGPFDAVVRDETVYVASGDKFVYALDAATGTLRWKSSTGSSNTRLSLCGRTIVVDILGYSILDAATGRLLFSGGNRSETDYLLSGFAVRDGIAVQLGSEYVEAFRCDRP